MTYKRSSMILFLVGMLVCFPGETRSQVDEYLLKAGFIERITRFVTWPEDSIKSDSVLPFTITVIGKNPFDSKLETFFASTRIKNREVEIRYVSSPEELKGTHILFISQSEQKHLDRILETVEDQPIITMGETEGYANEGVMINFYTENNRIRMEINQETVNRSGLHISHLLLSSVRIIG